MLEKEWKGPEPDEYRPNKGSFRLSFYTSNKPPFKGVTVKITDDTSHVQVVDAEITLEGLATALSSCDVDCTFQITRPDLIGMRAENKTEVVPFDCYGGDRKDRDKAAREAVKPFEVDGWRARIADMTNGHCRVDGGQSVVFYRHVNPKTGEPIHKNS